MQEQTRQPEGLPKRKSWGCTLPCEKNVVRGEKIVSILPSKQLSSDPWDRLTLFRI